MPDASVQRRVVVCFCHHPPYPQKQYKKKQVALARQTETAALKAAGLSSSGLKSGTFQRQIVGVFTRTTYNPDDPALAFVNQVGGCVGGGYVCVDVTWLF